MQGIRVGFYSYQNYLDRNAWSGTLFRMYQALKSTELEIINLGFPKKPSLVTKLVNRLQKKNSKPPELGSPEFVQKYHSFAAKVQKQLVKTPCDFIFAPVADREIYFLDTNIPIISASDTTVELWSKYYSLPWKPEELEWSLKQEKAVFEKVSKLIYSSEWAANSAINNSHVRKDKIAIIPYGANIDNPPSIEQIKLYKSKNFFPCKLLFIGKNWQRKGGDIAVETLNYLEKMGINAKLTILGSIPPEAVKNQRIKVIPFLDKNSPAQRQQFDDLLLSSHFFIFPTRGDCSPIVTCEANAFGLPVITTDVGGIPTIIKNGKNGYMLPLSATGEDFAKVIANIISEPTEYENLVYSSREEYEQRLNWQKWAESVFKVIKSMIN